MLTGSTLVLKIKLHELPIEIREKTPVNPNIPFARGREEEEEREGEGTGVSLEEVMNPFLDKRGAWVGAVISMYKAILTMIGMFD
jgi:hypothetical protein